MAHICLANEQTAACQPEPSGSHALLTQLGAVCVLFGVAVLMVLHIGWQAPFPTPLAMTMVMARPPALQPRPSTS